MKVAIFFVVAFAIFAQFFVRPQVLVQKEELPATRKDIVQKIENKLESIKNVRDPIGETNIIFDIPKNDYVNGKLEMAVVFLFGQAKVTMENFAYNDSSSELQFTLFWKDHIVFMTTNNNQITIGNGTDVIEEKSQIRIVFTGLRIQGKALVGESNIYDLSLVTSLASSSFQMSGLLNDDIISVGLSNILTANLKQFLDNHVSSVSKILSPLVEAAINYYL
ncbi:hypothetical protein NQ317_018538 [Molorchus minor]|uniref:Uncharacterized protein n=1 Tax=Molorchus minor TaxID=1323400 RepID=A0ABQ9JWE2_9CUCU|nr:hypothetical protein NQ317_018538 [Molorchus minor]